MGFVQFYNNILLISLRHGIHIEDASQALVMQPW